MVYGIENQTKKNTLTFFVKVNLSTFWLTLPNFYVPSSIQSSAPAPSDEKRPCFAHLTNLVTLFFTWPMPTHASSPVTIPPFAVLNLMPKPPLGPPGSWLAVRIIPPMALHFLIMQEMAGVDMIPCCPMTRRPTCGNVTQVCLSWLPSERQRGAVIPTATGTRVSFNSQGMFFQPFQTFSNSKSLLFQRKTNRLWEQIIEYFHHWKMIVIIQCSCKTVSWVRHN